jgi:chitodextrinase
MGLISLSQHGRVLATSAAPVNGLVGYWALDDGSGTTAVDSSGNGNNATLVNSPTWTAGQVNGALQFNGSNSYASVPANGGLNVSGQFSITMWVKDLSNNQSLEQIFGRDDYSGRLLFGGWGEIKAEFGDEFDTPLYVLPTGSWHHVAYVAGSSGETLYVDGAVVASDTFTGATFVNSNPIFMGDSISNAYPFNGSLDEVRVYNRALSASEVLAVMNDPGLPGGSSGSAPAIFSFSASPGSITSGQSSILSWTTSGAASLSINNGVGTVAGSSVSVSPTVTTTYTLTAANSYGSVTSNTTVTVSSGSGSDTTPPSVPTNLTASGISVSQINLSWTASTDNVGVTGYKIYRGGVQVGTSAVNSYSDTGLSASTGYTYTVSAYDAAGNNSAQSSSASAATQSPSSGSGEVGPFLGIGCTTAYHIDKDCDGYGVGTDPNDPHPLKGPDADDNDPTVNTAASMIAKYGTLQNFLSTAKGYNPNNIIYLSTTGNDSTCAANNAALPCATFTVAESKVSAGDAIVLRGGIFKENNNYYIPNSGGTSAASPDIIMSYPGELAILDHGSAGWYGIDGGPINYTIFDGLKLQNTPDVGDGIGIDLSAGAVETGIIIRNTEVRDYYRGIWIIAGLKNLLIENDAVHDDNPNSEHNIYLGQNGGSGGDAVNVIVRNNLLYNASWDNFHFNGLCDGCTLAGNIMYSANLTQGGGSANIALQQGWNHGFIQNNVVFNSSAWGLTFNDYDDPQPAIKPYNQNYNIISNNTFIHTGRDASGQDLSASGFAPIAIINNSVQTSPALDLGHNTYDNNIIVEMAAGGGSYDALVHYQKNQAGDPNWLATDAWQNNILYASNGAAPLAFGVGSQPPAQTWAYFSSNAGTFTNNSQVNPNLVASNPAWFNAPQNWDLHLQAGSPAISAGTAVNAPATDITGATRANPPSIGAYEYTGSSSGGTDTTAPSVPQSLSAIAVSSSAINLTWSASTDNVGVTGYDIYRNGSQIGTSAANSYSDTNLSAGTLYSYTVSAYDAAGNNSSQSASASATTSSNPDTTPPTVSITSPSSGTVSGTLTFSAQASDPTVTGQVTSGLKSLTLYVDGSIFATSSSGSISKSLDTTTLTNTTHTLTAIALDNAGNQSTTATVSITVNNASATKYPRTITLTSLEGISTIPAGTTITATVLSGSTVLETQSNLTSTAGKYTITFLASDPQLVNIRIKVNGYLSQLLTSIDTTVNSVTALSVPQLSAGDFNNDNAVNSLDYSLMNTHWLTNYPTADINADGIVNSLDFAILKNNYNKSGQ